MSTYERPTVFPDELEDMTPHELHWTVIDRLAYTTGQELLGRSYNFNVIDAIDAYIVASRQSSEASQQAKIAETDVRSTGSDPDLGLIWAEAEEWDLARTNMFLNIDEAMKTRFIYGPIEGRTSLGDVLWLLAAEGTEDGSLSELLARPTGETRDSINGVRVS